MMSLPPPDYEITDRLLHSDDPGKTGAAIMSAVAAFLIGSLGRAQAAEIMRDFRPPADRPASIVGPALTGHAVLIEGRLIPRLKCFPVGDRITIILDDRFSIEIAASEAYQTAWLLAQALAIGAGYSHLSANAPGRPFAPEMKIGAI